MDIEKRLKRTFLIVAGGLVIGGLFAFAQVYFGTNGGSAVVVNKGSTGSGIAGVQLGGPYTLVDQDGKTVTEKDFVDKYKLIYFGFTYCPAVCPTELQRIAQIMKGLPEDLAAQVQPLFISVDPERDTPEVMKEYVAMFDPRLIGLTGTPEQIETIKQEYRIYAAKVPTEDGSDYTMDHSSFIYFMSPEDQALSIFRTQDSVEYMTEAVKREIPIDVTNFEEPLETPKSAE